MRNLSLLAMLLLCAGCAAYDGQSGYQGSSSSYAAAPPDREPHWESSHVINGSDGTTYVFHESNGDTDIVHPNGDVTTVIHDSDGTTTTVGPNGVDIDTDHHHDHDDDD